MGSADNGSTGATGDVHMTTERELTNDEIDVAIELNRSAINPAAVARIIARHFYALGLASRPEREPVAWMSKHITDDDNTVQVLAFTKADAERAMRSIPKAAIVPLYAAHDEGSKT
jgi:hypothetical protein